MANRAVAVFELVRPWNAGMASLAALAGGLTVAPFESAPWSLVAAALVVFFGVGGGNALNDAVDAEVDRSAHPRRPVPRGALSVREARWWAWACFGVALGVAFLLGLGPGFLALACVVALAWYEGPLKQRAFGGHLVVSLVVGGTFVFGAVAMLELGFLPGVDGWRDALARGFLGSALMMGGLAALANLARELFKSMEDVEADRPHRRTAATVWGPVATRWVAVLCIVAALGLAVWVVGWGDLFETRVLGWLLAPSVALFGAAVFQRDAGRSSRATKLGMALATFGFLAIGLI